MKIFIYCFCVLFTVDLYGQITVVTPKLLSIIGTTTESRFLGAQALGFCPDGSLVVSDKLAYKVMKFDRKGRRIAETGKRGTGAGEFRGPASISAYGNVIAVADFASPRIHLFSAGLQYQKTIVMPGAILEIQFDSRGDLWAALLQPQSKDNLVRVSIDGTIRQNIGLEAVSQDMLENAFYFSFTPDDEIVIAYYFRNTIELWSRDGSFIKSFQVSGFPATVRKKRISDQLSVPEDNVIYGVTIDKQGTIFVLAGEYSHSPRRDVFGVDRTGNLISLAVLPEPSSLIEIGSDDRLYSIERNRTRISVYRLDQ